jgi:biotin carboxyl carrier protein
LFADSQYSASGLVGNSVAAAKPMKIQDSHSRVGKVNKVFDASGSGNCEFDTSMLLCDAENSIDSEVAPKSQPTPVQPRTVQPGPKAPIPKVDESSPSSPKQHVPGRGQSSAGVFFDSNVNKPNGTEASIEQMLRVTARAFQGEVFLGRNRGGSIEKFSSRASSFRETPAVTIDSALVEASHAKTTCLYANEATASSGVLQELRENEHACLVLSMGFDAGGDSWGVVICIPESMVGDQSFLPTHEVIAFLLDSLRKELPPWLEIWTLCRTGQKTKTWWKRAAFYRERKGRVGLAVALLMLMSLAAPLPYWPRRECIVEPAARRFLASPVNGRVLSAQVRPGDVVHTGQLLAKLDDEQLRWDLSAAEADYESASKRRDSALATRAGGEMRLAQLEQERIAIEIESIEKQLEQLEIRSPFDGIVVQGDWFRSEGAPVGRGDTLFEIAPLERMRVETRLTTEDLGNVKVGKLATVRVDAAQGEIWQGTLSRIDPRGQVIDSKVIFVAEMEVDNRDNLLRPGMKGSARITAGHKSLGWLLFHSPYVWLMKRLAW